MELRGWGFIFAWKRGVKVFLLENVLKDVILYVKQLKFMVLAHSKLVLKVFLWSGGVKVFLYAFSCVEGFSPQPDTKSPTSPHNKWPLP